MNFEKAISDLERNSGAVAQLVNGVSERQARWKPDPDSWSILEVVNHLYDEERKDFRTRLNIILHQPDQPWPEIDPEGWVTAKKYNERNLKESLDNYLKARRESIRWLRGLDSPDWQAAYTAPWGEMTAGDMFASWVAHDLLHLRQLVELQWAYTTLQLAPYQVEYAGGW